MRFPLRYFLIKLAVPVIGALNDCPLPLTEQSVTNFLCSCVLDVSGYRRGGHRERRVEIKALSCSSVRFPCRDRRTRRTGRLAFRPVRSSARLCHQLFCFRRYASFVKNLFFYAVDPLTRTPHEAPPSSWTKAVNGRPISRSARPASRPTTANRERTAAIASRRTSTQVLKRRVEPLSVSIRNIFRPN